MVTLITASDPVQRVIGHRILQLIRLRIQKLEQSFKALMRCGKEFAIVPGRDGN
jgi:hypothetical protein